MIFNPPHTTPRVHNLPGTLLPTLAVPPPTTNSPGTQASTVLGNTGECGEGGRHKVSAHTKVAYQPKSLKTGGHDRCLPAPRMILDYNAGCLSLFCILSIYMALCRYHDATGYRYIYEVDTSGMKPCPTSTVFYLQRGGDKEKGHLMLNDRMTNTAIAAAAAKHRPHNIAKYSMQILKYWYPLHTCITATNMPECR